MENIRPEAGESTGAFFWLAVDSEPLVALDGAQRLDVDQGAAAVAGGAGAQ